MNIKLIFEYTQITTLVASIFVLAMMYRHKLLATFNAVALFVAVAALHEMITIPLMFFRRYTGVSVGEAYNVLFYGNLIFYALTAAFLFASIYGVFSVAMKPLAGLQRIGKIVFRWIAGVSLLFASVIALGPHLFVTGLGSSSSFANLIERVQEGVSVLTLCLLVFVCFAIKPLGLSYRSRVFGVTLGLGMFSTMQLAESAWLSTNVARSVYSPIFLISAIGYVAVLATWGAYFATAEPERKMILLPTTSPFFHWNRISEALGDAPGNVAISFTASMISPIETKVMTAMSKGSRERATLARVRAESELEAELDSTVA